MREIILIVHNVRSCHNVGSLLRTAEGLGVETVYLSGYTPYPQAPNDKRLPHIFRKANTQIHKTALGAEDMLSWQHSPELEPVVISLKKRGFTIAAVEQAKNSISLQTYNPPPKLALIVGREVEGIEPKILTMCDQILEIPMLGQKESFNVVQAAAIVLYHCQFTV